MDLKTFFGLHEGLIHEMAGMPQDNPFNSFMYKKIMEKYGHRWVGQGGAWPKGTSYEQKMADVEKWVVEAYQAGVSPSKGWDNVKSQSVVSQLDWPFRVGSGQKSKNAATNMRSLVVKIGFADPNAMEKLWQTEGEAAPAAEPAAAASSAGSTPKVQKAFQVKQRGARPLSAAISGAEPTPPTVRKGGAEEPAPEPAEEPAAAVPEPTKSSEQPKSSDSWSGGSRRVGGGYKPPEDDPDFQ